LEQFLVEGEVFPKISRYLTKGKLPGLGMGKSVIKKVDMGVVYKEKSVVGKGRVRFAVKHVGSLKCIFLEVVE
jgi:hypothetical protein